MQKKRLLYIGNKLANANATITTLDSLSDKLRLEGYEIITASSKKNKFLRLCSMLFSVIKNRNYTELVLIDTYSTQNFWYAICVAWLCRRFRLPYIPILHGGNLPNRLISNKKTCEIYFKKAKMNVAPSYYLKEAFENAGHDNLVLIPNSIDIEKYPFSERTIETPKLLWVRSFSKIYNPKLAISIFAIVKEKYPEAELCMVGPEKDGSLLECKKLAENLQLKVKFTGLIPKNEWIKLSENYNIFINTTNFDNMPVSVIEAMALGLPVISTDVGGIPSLIKNREEGLLVAPNNALAFVEAIAYVLGNDMLIQSITKKARMKVEPYSWNEVKNMWILLLER